MSCSCILVTAALVNSSVECTPTSSVVSVNTEIGGFDDSVKEDVVEVEDGVVFL